MSDFECADCKLLWRNYAEAMTKHANLENQQKKAASSGYLSLFKDLTNQLHRVELHREECRFQITSHEQDRHGKEQMRFRLRNLVAAYPYSVPISIPLELMIYIDDELHTVNMCTKPEQDLVQPLLARCRHQRAEQIAHQPRKICKTEAWPYGQKLMRPGLRGGPGRITAPGHLQILQLCIYRIKLGVKCYKKFFKKTAH